MPSFGYLQMLSYMESNRASGRFGAKIKEGCFVGEQVGISACGVCILWQNKCQSNGNIYSIISPFKHYLINSILSFYRLYVLLILKSNAKRKGTIFLKEKMDKFIGQAQSMQKDKVRCKKMPKQKEQIHSTGIIQIWPAIYRPSYHPQNIYLLL